MPKDDKPTYAKNYLVNKWKLSPIAASGIVGNLQAESSLNTKAVGDNGTSYGIAQWHNERRDALNNFARKQNKDASHLDTQLDYLVYELNTGYKKAFNKINTAKTPEEAAVAFMNHFERPAEWAKKESVGRRVGYAKNVFGDKSETSDNISYKEESKQYVIEDNNFFKDYVSPEESSVNLPLLSEDDEEPSKQFKSDLAKDRLVQQEVQDNIVQQLSTIYQQPQQQIQEEQPQEVVQINPSLYQVYNIEHPDYTPPQFQQGGGFKLDKEAVNYLNNYYNSPIFKDRYLKFNGLSDYANQLDVSRKAVKNLKPYIINKENPKEPMGSRISNPQMNKVYSDEYNNIPLDANVILSVPQSKKINSDINTSILPHEYSHLGRPITWRDELETVSRNKDPKAMKLFSEFNQWKTKDPKRKGEIFSTYLIDKVGEQHNFAPNENHADLDALRYQMYKEGIYDTNKKPMTKQDLEKAKKNPKINNTLNFKRLLKNFKEDDIIWMNNNIASTISNPEDNDFYAQSGGEMPNFQKGRVKLNKSIVADNTRVFSPFLPLDNSKKQIDKSKQAVANNTNAIEKDKYYNPEVIKGISSGDKMVDFVYNNQWLMDVPAVGDYIKYKAKELAYNSHGRPTIDNVNEAKADEITGKFTGSYKEDNFTKSTLVDQYFSKKALFDKARYKPKSDYLEFLPTYSLKGDFERHANKKDIKEKFAKVLNSTLLDKVYGNKPEEYLNISTGEDGNDGTLAYKKFLEVKKPIYINNIENSDLAQLLGVNLGGHKTGLAWDSEVNLPYISVSDAWDFEPKAYSNKWAGADVAMKGKKDIIEKERQAGYIQASLMHKAGNPFKVYDRFYFNPDTKEYIPDVKVAQINKKK